MVSVSATKLCYKCRNMWFLSELSVISSVTLLPYLIIPSQSVYKAQLLVWYWGKI